MRKTHKLLAVMIWIGSAQASADAPRTLASGAPACGNAMGKGAESLAQRQARALCRAEASLATTRERLAAARFTEAVYVKNYLTTPRRLASGAPACGNVMSKDEAPCTDELADLHAARRLHEVKQAFERTAKERAEVHEATRTVATLRQAIRGSAAEVATLVDPKAR